MRLHSRVRPLRWLLAAPLILAAAGCGRQEEAPDLGPIVRPVGLATVGAEDVARLSFPGTIQATDRAELSFRVSGDLVQLPINEGDFIEAGQLVGQLDTRDFEIDVQEATAIFNQARAERDRYQRLYESEAVPLADLELRIAQRDVAAARLQQAETNLEYTTLTAPFGGWVGRRLRENFERVAAQETVITLHDIRFLEVVIDVPELIVARFQQGSTPNLAATFSAAPGQEYPLTLKEVAAEADPATRTYQVVLTLPRPRGIDARPGMTVTAIARPSAGRPNAHLTIPAQAVFADDNGVSHVWVVDQAARTVSRRRVTLGEVTGEADVEILEGLSLGETIAITAVSVLQDGMQVRPMSGSGR